MSKLLKSSYWVTLAIMVGMLVLLRSAFAGTSISGEIEFMSLRDHVTGDEMTVPFLYRDDTGDSVMLIGLDSKRYKNGDVIRVYGENEVDYFYVEDAERLN